MNSPNFKGCIKQCTGKPEVSIVIPAYNESQNILDTLRTIGESVRQSMCACEVLVVNNASKDDTGGKAEYAGAIVVDEDSKGLAKARQKGIESANGGIVLGTDADSRVPPTWINAHIKHYEKIDVVGATGLVKFDKTHPLYKLYQWGAYSLHLSVDLLKQIGLVENSPLCGLVGANFSYRRSTALNIGYPPEINLGEDMNMGIELSKRGDVVHDCSPECVVVTDGRRFQSACQVVRFTLWKTHLLLRGKLYKYVNDGVDFDDIR